MRREQEDVLDARLLARTQQSLRTTFRRAEQSKCIGNLVRAVLGDGGGIVRFRNVEAGFPQPAKIRDTRIGEERLSRREPAPHPSRSHLGIGSETERDHEHHREPGQGTAGPAAPASR